MILKLVLAIVVSSPEDILNKLIFNNQGTCLFNFLSSYNIDNLEINILEEFLDFFELL